MEDVEAVVVGDTLSSPLARAGSLTGSTAEGHGPDGSEEECCAICLGTSGETLNIGLECGHSYCSSCWTRHLELLRQHSRSVYCPLCRTPVPGMGNEGVQPQGVPEPSVWQVPAGGDTRAFMRAARQAHLKYCPGCRAMIVKNGGCDHMTCRCGHVFNWSQAESVARCRQVHLNRQGFPLWCTTCEGCSHIAKMKLALVRAGVVVAAVPATLSVAGVGIGVASVIAAGVLTTAAVPAVVCGPFALAYEPVLRLRGRGRNPFKRGMSSGVRLLVRLVRPDDD